MPQHHLAVSGHIGGNTAERHHQTIEISTGLRRKAGKKLHKGKVHGYGGYQRGRHSVLNAVSLAAHIKAEQCRRRLGHCEIIAQRRVYFAGRPVRETLRQYQVEHLVGSVSGGIQAADYSTHRSAAHIVDWYVGVFKRTNHTYMGNTLGASAAQHQAHRLTATYRAHILARLSNTHSRHKHGNNRNNNRKQLAHQFINESLNPRK